LVNVSAKLQKGELDLSWDTNIGTNGKAKLKPSNATKLSVLAPENVGTWNQFREFVRDLEPYRYIFRGQESNSWRLRTSFHRAGRFDIYKFTNTDVFSLHQHLTSLTHHVFNVGNPIEHAAFLNLVQHHGYPTPLLDWTYSPYVGAFFAYRRAKPTASGDKVRVFVFDQKEWHRDFSRVGLLALMQPFLSVLQALSIENPRSIPQQAVSTVTNLDDIESYVADREAQTGKKYLRAIDLPVPDRKTILTELAMMGVTAGSLFPGLDGACEQLRERFFNYP
jgi:hypothetical protein